MKILLDEFFENILLESLKVYADEFLEAFVQKPLMNLFELKNSRRNIWACVVAIAHAIVVGIPEEIFEKFLEETLKELLKQSVEKSMQESSEAFTRKYSEDFPKEF